MLLFDPLSLMFMRVGVVASGALWALSTSGAAATRLAAGLDPLTRLASGPGRIVAHRFAGAAAGQTEGKPCCCRCADHCDLTACRSAA